MQKQINLFLKIGTFVCLLLDVYALARNVKQGENLWMLERKTTESVFDRLITQQDINAAPFIITIPGSYALAEDIQFSSGTAVTISTDNVLFDLNNHTIQCLSTATGTSIVVNAGRIVNFVSIGNGFIKVG